MIPENTISDTESSVRPPCPAPVQCSVCVRTICLGHKDDRGYCTHDLTAPVSVTSRHLTGASLCRMCAIRLRIPMLERLLLIALIEEAEHGGRSAYTYGELAQLVGRGVHSVETAVSSLRKAGFLTSSRISRTGSYVLFSVDAFLRWGEALVSASGAPVVSSSPHEVQARASAPTGRRARPRRASRAGAKAAAAATGAPRSVEAGEFFDTFSPDDHPDWPDVPGNWRALNGVPMPGSGNFGDMSVQVGQKPWLGPVPRLPDGSFDEEKLRRHPIELMDLDGEEFHARCELDRPVMTADTPIAVDDEPVDPRPEIEATLQAAGGRKPADADSSELDFSSGVDTDGSDMDPRVPINVDI